MTLEWWFGPRGLLEPEACLLLLTTLAAIISYVRIGWSRSRLFIGRWLLATGWTILAVRFWLAAINRTELIIPIASLIALSLIAAGHLLISIRAMYLKQP